MDPIDWPCQTQPSEDLPEWLVAFLYRLLRDGATAPSDVEAHAIQACKHPIEGPLGYTNAHLEGYARSLATALLGGPDAVA